MNNIYLSRKRNTDKSLYLRSEKAKTCPLCGRYYTQRMVHHFKSCHKQSEVFVSRISSEMAELVEKGQHSKCIVVKRENNGQTLQLEMLCLFCEEVKNFPPPYWIDHIHSHTGEYGNYCQVCDQRCGFAIHCNVTTTKVDDFDLRTTNMDAYRCVECNFIQTHYTNMVKHLTVQHQYKDIKKRHYQKFILLPTYYSVEESNSNDVANQGKV